MFSGEIMIREFVKFDEDDINNQLSLLDKVMCPICQVKSFLSCLH